METWQIILIAIPVIFLLMFFLVSKLIGGMAATFIFGFLVRGMAKAISLFFNAIAWLVRKVIFSSKDFSNKRDNEDKVWNIQAAISFALSLLFLIYTPTTLLSVYQYESKGWLFLAIIGLFSIYSGPKIATAPFMKKYNFTKEWGTAIALFITALTTASAVVHLLFRFFYVSVPTFTLFVSLLVYLVFIGFITYKLIDDKGISTLARLAKAMEKNKKSKDITDTTADFQIALSKPTKKKPNSVPITLLEKSRLTHTQIIGSTGTGKSILATNLSVQDLLQPKHGVIVMEPTEDLVNNLKVVSKNINRNYFYINPSNEDSDIINPLDGIDIDVIADSNADVFVGYLGKNTNDFYKRQQVNALKTAIKAVKYIKKDDATYLDLLELLRPNSSQLRKQYINEIEDNSIRRDLQDYDNQHNQKQPSQNFEALFDYLKEITGNKYLKRILCGTSTANLRDIFNNGDVLLISTDIGTLQGLSSTFGKMILKLISSEVFARSKVEPEKREELPFMAIYVDEFQNYVTEKFSDIFEMARKLGVAMHIMHQGLDQLRDVSDSFAQTVYNNSRQKIVFSGIDYNDADMISKSIGEYYENVKTTSSSVFNPLQVNTSSSEQLRYKMTPAEIRNIPGFQKKTMSAEALLLLVEDNVIQPPQIGLISPLPWSVFEEIEYKIEDGVISEHNDNTVPTEEIFENKQEFEESASNKDNIVPKDYSSGNNKPPKIGNIDVDADDEKSDNNGEENVIDLLEPKKKRRKRGKRGKGQNSTNNLVEEESNNTVQVEEDNKEIAKSIEGEIIDEDDNFDDILLELTDSK